MDGNSINKQEINYVSPIGLEQYQEKIIELLESSVSENTKKALKSDITQFIIWWSSKFQTGYPFPSTPIILASYIAHMNESGKTKSTIIRSISSIRKIHRIKNMDDPYNEVVKGCISGISRTNTRSLKKAKALSIKDILSILDKSGKDWLETRNSAILSIGWLCALRCSEISSLNISDIGNEDDNGIIVTIRHSKTDQDNVGIYLALPYSKLTERVIYWRSRLLSLYTDGPLFPGFGKMDKWFPKIGSRKRLTDRSISLIIKNSVKLIGLDSSLYSPHSLRAGFCTDAAKAGVPEYIIQRHSRHKSITVLRGYIQNGNCWEENPLPAIFDSFPSSK